MQANRPRIHRLRDGSVIRTRPLRASDRGKLLDGFEHFSPDSRYRRFFSPTPRLTSTMLDRLFDIDGEDRVAIGAELLRLGFVPGSGLGIARFARLPEAHDVAEMAVSIVDEMQGQGLGTVLLLELSAAARAHGIARFTAWVQPDNEAMKALVAKLDPLARSHVEDGVLVFDLAVPGTIELASEQRPRRVTNPLVGFADWCTASARQLFPGRLTGTPLSHF